MSKSYSNGDPPVSYTYVTNASVHNSLEQPSCNPAGPSHIGFKGPTSQYTGTGPYTSHTALGSSHSHHHGHHNEQTSSGEGNELPHHSYHTVQPAPLPVQGRYHYSSSQGMVPMETPPGFQATPFARDDTERMAAIRRKKLEKKCLIRVAIVFGVLTVIALIIAFVLRNSLIIGYHTP